MEYLSFILYTLIFISILTPVAIVIFEFFDLKFEVYGNYLLWFIALALFNAILPVKTKNIFGDIAKPIEEMVSKVKSTANDMVQAAAKTAEKYKLPAVGAELTDAAVAPAESVAASAGPVAPATIDVVEPKLKNTPPAAGMKPPIKGKKISGIIDNMLSSVSSFLSPSSSSSSDSNKKPKYKWYNDEARMKRGISEFKFF